MFVLRVFGAACSFALLRTAGMAQTTPVHAQAPRPDAGQLFTAYDATTFRSVPAAATKIDLEKIDDDLLSAAVFHETNKRRLEHGLAAFRYDPRVRAAAQMQAEHMASLGVVSHDNAIIPAKATPADRLRLAGLKVGFVGENAGTAFGIVYTRSEQVYPRNENGRKFLSRDPTGEAIPAHTYLSFAEAWLDDLIASPIHRGNIISPKPLFLGVSCRLKVNELGMPLFYGVQKFYSPPGAVPKTQ